MMGTENPQNDHIEKILNFENISNEKIKPLLDKYIELKDEYLAIKDDFIKNILNKPSITLKEGVKLFSLIEKQNLLISQIYSYLKYFFHDCDLNEENSNTPNISTNNTSKPNEMYNSNNSFHEMRRQLENEINISQIDEKNQKFNGKHYITDSLPYENYIIEDHKINEKDNNKNLFLNHSEKNFCLKNNKYGDKNNETDHLCIFGQNYDVEKLDYNDINNLNLKYKIENNSFLNKSNNIDEDKEKIINKIVKNNSNRNSLHFPELIKKQINQKTKCPNIVQSKDQIKNNIKIHISDILINENNSHEYLFENQTLNQLKNDNKKLSNIKHIDDYKAKTDNLISNSPIHQNLDEINRVLNQFDHKHLDSTINHKIFDMVYSDQITIQPNGNELVDIQNLKLISEGSIQVENISSSVKNSLNKKNFFNSNMAKNMNSQTKSNNKMFKKLTNNNIINSQSPSRKVVTIEKMNYSFDNNQKVLNSNKNCKITKKEFNNIDTQNKFNQRKMTNENENTYIYSDEINKIDEVNLKINLTEVLEEKNSLILNEMPNDFKHEDNTKKNEQSNSSDLSRKQFSKIFIKNINKVPYFNHQQKNLGRNQNEEKIRNISKACRRNSKNNSIISNDASSSGKTNKELNNKELYQTKTNKEKCSSKEKTNSLEINSVFQSIEIIPKKKNNNLQLGYLNQKNNNENCKIQSHQNKIIVSNSEQNFTYNQIDGNNSFQSDSRTNPSLKRENYNNQDFNCLSNECLIEKHQKGDMKSNQNEPHFKKISNNKENHNNYFISIPRSYSYSNDGYKQKENMKILKDKSKFKTKVDIKENSRNDYLEKDHFQFKSDKNSSNEGIREKDKKNTEIKKEILIEKNTIKNIRNEKDEKNLQKNQEINLNLNYSNIQVNIDHFKKENNIDVDDISKDFAIINPMSSFRMNNQLNIKAGSSFFSANQINILNSNLNKIREDTEEYTEDVSILSSNQWEDLKMEDFFHQSNNYEKNFNSSNKKKKHM